MESLSKTIVFYTITGIPAYLLIYLGLTGTGTIPSYSYGNFSWYVPSQQFALYFLLVGSGMIFGMILHLFKKYDESKFEEMVDFLRLRSGLHTHHCEISSLGTYVGIGALAAVVLMYFILQISILSNLIILFGISLASGIGAVVYYRKDNDKWPF